MIEDKINKESEKKTLEAIQKKMALPRLAKSVRKAVATDKVVEELRLAGFKLVVNSRDRN
jgi:hypothetical protein